MVGEGEEEEEAGGSCLAYAAEIPIPLWKYAVNVPHVALGLAAARESNANLSSLSTISLARSWF